MMHNKVTELTRSLALTYLCGLNATYCLGVVEICAKLFSSSNKINTFTKRTKSWPYTFPRDIELQEKNEVSQWRIVLVLWTYVSSYFEIQELTRSLTLTSTFGIDLPFKKPILHLTHRLGAWTFVTSCNSFWNQKLPNSLNFDVSLREYPNMQGFVVTTIVRRKIYANVAITMF